MTTVIVPGGLLWLPELQVVNAVDELYEVLNDAQFAFRITSDGNVWYHPTGQIATRCRFFLLYYPVKNNQMEFYLVLLYAIHLLV